MKREKLSPMARNTIDIAIVMACGAACLFAAYQLINGDFLTIYTACFVIVAIAIPVLSSMWLKNAFLSLATLLFVLAFAELVLSFAEPGAVASERQSASYTKGYSQPLRENGGALGYRPYPDREVRSWKTFGNEKLYDVVYTIDADGYRQVPGFGDPEEAGAPVVFFGGSFAFGEGVNDDETLAYFFAAATDWRYPVRNLGFSGYGPHQMLRSLELGTLRDLGYSRVDITIYEAVPDHARRAAGGAWWDPVGPRYALHDAGGVQYEGRFTNVPDAFIKPYYRYLQVVKVARRSRVVDWTANLLFGAVAVDPDANVRLMVEIVNTAARIMEQDYGASFVVLFWDDETEESALLLEGLASANIVTIKVSDLIPPAELADYQIPNDAHPTAAANQRIAQGLVERLGDLDLESRGGEEGRIPKK